MMGVVFFFLSKAAKAFEATESFGVSKELSLHLSELFETFLYEKISWKQLRRISDRCGYTSHGFCLLKHAFGLGQSKCPSCPVSNQSCALCIDNDIPLETKHQYQIGKEK